MTKQSQRRTLRHEKDKSGCMRGLINMFDFRNGHTTQKFIAEGRGSGKHTVGSIHSKNKFQGLSDFDEVTEGDIDNGESKRLTIKAYANKPSVKKLIEEEMFSDQNPVKDLYNAKLGSKKAAKKSRDIIITDTDTDDLNSDATLKSESSHKQHSRQQCKDNIDLNKIIAEFFHIKDVSSMMHGNDGDVDVQSKQKHTISENIARDAIDEFVNQMMLNSKDLAEARKFLCSDELREALELIKSSEKEFSIPVRQDPNSLLLKYVQDFVNSQRKMDKDCSSVNGSDFSEQELGNLEETKEIVNNKKYNFFRRMVKSQSKSSTNENGNTDFSNRIVILKPGSMDLRNSATENNTASHLHYHDEFHANGPYGIGSSHFFLTEIKKKLKHAMGRKKHGNSKEISRKYSAESQNKGSSGKAIGKDNVGMRSPNKDRFFIEKIARPTNDVMKGDKTGGTLKDSESNTEHENGSYPKPKLSNLYIEAKKHLSEILSNGDESIELSSRKSPSTLARILSLPGYNFSPLGSPVRDLEHNFVTAQTRYSAPNKTLEDNENNLSPEQAACIDHLDRETDNPEKQSCICGKSSNDKVQEIESDSDFSHDHNQVIKEENSCLVRDESEGDLESAKEIDIVESFSEPLGLGKGKENNDVSEILDSASCSQCMNQDVIEENQISYPLSLPFHSSITNKIDELESGSDIFVRPSPVSVLDTFLEDDVSLGYSGFKPVEVRARPLQLEEQDSLPMNPLQRNKHCLEDDELIYDYIKKILQASGLTEDQLIKKCLSSDKILEPSLFDQVDLLSNRLCQDQQLLYDCTNEVLMEVCWHYFGISPFVSFINPATRLTPNMQRVITKVWEGVCWYFLPFPPPRTLDKIVRKDMDKPGSWMDLRFEAETVGFEMSEAILDELIEDTILSCISEKPEGKCYELQLELEEKTITNV